jgi:hypothetical protein
MHGQVIQPSVCTSSYDVTTNCDQRLRGVAAIPDIRLHCTCTFTRSVPSSSSSSRLPADAPGIWGRIPRRNKNFTGRSDHELGGATSRRGDVLRLLLCAKRLIRGGEHCWTASPISTPCESPSTPRNETWVSLRSSCTAANPCWPGMSRSDLVGTAGRTEPARRRHNQIRTGARTRSPPMFCRRRQAARQERVIRALP